MSPRDGSLLTSAAYSVGPTKDKGSLFLSHYLTSGLASPRTARSATEKSWENGEQNYKNKKMKKKKVGSPYPLLTPALTNDQNKGAENSSRGQQRNEAIT